MPTDPIRSAQQTHRELVEILTGRETEHGPLTEQDAQNLASHIAPCIRTVQRETLSSLAGASEEIADDFASTGAADHARARRLVAEAAVAYRDAHFPKLDDSV